MKTKYERGCPKRDDLPGRPYENIGFWPDIFREKRLFGQPRSLRKIIIFLILLIFPFQAKATKEIKKEKNNPYRNTTQIEKFKAEKVFPTGLNDLSLLNKLIGKELLKAISKKKLIVQPHTKLQIEQLSTNGFCQVPGKGVRSIGGYITVNYRAYASKELIALLYSLVNSPEISAKKPVGLLSLFRYGRNHGQLQSDGTLIGRAVDIDNYGGFRINMADPRRALWGIIKIIDRLPPWKYVLGLPRPGGGSLIDPGKDYYLPVLSLKQNERSPTGNLAGDLNLILNPEAKKAISDAINKNKYAKILFLMPDAVDHLHIKAVEQGAIQ